MADRSLEHARRMLLTALLVLMVAAVPVAALAEGALSETGEDVALEDAVGEAASGNAVEEPSEDETVEAVQGEEAPGPSDDEDSGTSEEAPASDGATDEVAAEQTPAEEPVEESVASTVDEMQEEPYEQIEPAAGLPAAPAGALTITEGTYVLQAMLAKTLLVEAAGKAPTAGTVLQTAAYTGAKNQKWVLKRYKDGPWYRLRMASDTALALGVTSATQGAGLAVVAVTSADQLETLWAFVPDEDGTIRLVSAANPALAICVKGSSTKSGAALTLASSKSAKDQRFVLRDTAAKVPAGTKGLEGAYLLTEKGSGLVAAIRGNSTANGASLQLAKRSGSNGQKIYLEPVDDGGYYIAWVVGSGKALGVSGGNVLIGASVHQRAYKKVAAQKWAVCKNEDGTLSFVNKGTGLSLAAEGTSAGDSLVGATEGSKFAAKRVALLKAGVVEIKPRTATAVSLSVAKASTKTGAGIQLWSDTDALNQRFELVAAGKVDLWRVRTGSSGGYLAVTDGKLSQRGKGATKANKTNVWRVTFRGGWYGLMLNDGSERAICLARGKTTKGTKLSVAAANGTDAQHLSFEAADLIKPGVCFIKNARGKLLDVIGNSAEPGVGLQTYQKISTRLLGEFFTIEKAGPYVRIKNTFNGCYVTARGAKAGSKVTVERGNKSNAQKWLPQIADGGFVVFRGVGAYKKLALNVNKGSAKDGARVLLQPRSGGVAQRWKTIAATYNPYKGLLLRARQAVFSNGSATGYAIVVDRANTRVYIFKREGTWEIDRIFLCSCGKPSTPTITGVYQVGSRGYSFTDGDHTCYYWTEIRGDYLFHSVLYHAGTMNVLDGRIGMHLSMGCVRLNINDARWIYDHIPAGSTIVIY